MGQFRAIRGIAEVMIAKVCRTTSNRCGVRKRVDQFWHAMGLDGVVDQYTEAGLPQPDSPRGYTRHEVEQLLHARSVEVPRDTQFRRLDDVVCGRQRRLVDGTRSGVAHRRWNAEQYLTLEAGCRLLGAGFSRSAIELAVAGEIGWDELSKEREARLRQLMSADLDIARLQRRFEDGPG